MFSFLKKMFDRSNDSSDLMEKTIKSSLLDDGSGRLSEDYFIYTPDGEIDEDRMRMNERIEEKYRGLTEEQQLRDLDEIGLQQQQNMHDPYQNPGQDIVVDESYHGIDHGSDDHHHHHNY